MKRLKILISLFCLFIAVPLGFVIWQTYHSLAGEESSQLRFFCERLFDAMEADLSDLVQREEVRAVDEYHHTLAGNQQEPQPSPLSLPPREAFIIGYLQNNPDGSFQTPLVPDLGRISTEQRPIIEKLKTINTIFNRKKFALTDSPPKPRLTADLEGKQKAQLEKEASDGFADRYLTRPPKKIAKDYLGKKSRRTEEITAGQALNLSREDESLLRTKQLKAESDKAPQQARATADNGASQMAAITEQTAAAEPGTTPKSDDRVDTNRFQVEVAPLQSVFIDAEHFFIFRRIGISNQIYRQGFVIRTRPFLQYLAATYFAPHPIAQFSRLSLQIAANGEVNEAASAGASLTDIKFDAQHVFPAPFDFCRATVQADIIPGSPARRTLNWALAVLGIVLLLGLFAIYHSVHMIVEVSERRSQFVSSVTHELKTPLTNIRMYVEMLEQGVAASPEREQDYFQILGSESSRLSRLINNVLELSKLEQKQRNFNMQSGNLNDVLREVERVMAPKLSQERFVLAILRDDIPQFSYDSEVMIQILINLIENSIKFGKSAIERRITIRVASIENRVQIKVSDRGPGIPGRALKKIFNDFYRVDNDLTRTTGGTGIGLALVNKFMKAMGGRAHAVNNDGAGCTIVLDLPITNPEQG